MMRPTVLAVAALCLLALPAVAEEGLPPTSQFFDEYDTNADGKVTADEFRGSGEIFKFLDRNGDGAIRPDELGLPADYKPSPKVKRKRAGGEAPAKGGVDARRARQMEQFRKRLMAMDADKDGRVSKEEWTGPAQAFDRVDRNKDGFIDKQDAPQRAAKGQGGKGQGGKGRRKGAGRRDAGPGGDRDPAARAKAYFARLDKNGDGKVVADEAPNPKLIDMADADKDGGVTLEEFTDFMRKRARQQGDARKRGGDDRRRGARLSAGMLRRWDRNGDGKVSKEEFPGRDELFARLDADKDGFLTEADGKAAGVKGAGKRGRTQPQKRGDVIDQQDTDGDGRLHRAEFQGTNSVWRLLDRNGDGWITKDELKPSKDR